MNKDLEGGSGRHRHLVNILGLIIVYLTTLSVPWIIQRRMIGCGLVRTGCFIQGTCGIAKDGGTCRIIMGNIYMVKYEGITF